MTCLARNDKDLNNPIIILNSRGCLETQQSISNKCPHVHKSRQVKKSRRAYPMLIKQTIKHEIRSSQRLRNQAGLLDTNDQKH